MAGEKARIDVPASVLTNKSVRPTWAVSGIGVPFRGVPIRRIILFWGIFRVTLLGEIPTFPSNECLVRPKP